MLTKVTAYKIDPKEGKFFLRMFILTYKSGLSKGLIWYVTGGLSEELQHQEKQFDAYSINEVYNECKTWIDHTLPCDYDIAEGETTVFDDVA